MPAHVMQYQRPRGELCDKDGAAWGLERALKKFANHHFSFTCPFGLECAVELW